MGTPQEAEIPVIFEGKKKWLTNLTRQTTCSDVIYSLLHSNSEQEGNVSSYELWECWRQAERRLSGRVKILKLWRAWGPEVVNVEFVVKRSSLSLLEVVDQRQSRTSAVKTDECVMEVSAPGEPDTAPDTIPSQPEVSLNMRRTFSSAQGFSRRASTRQSRQKSKETTSIGSSGSRRSYSCSPTRQQQQHKRISNILGDEPDSCKNTSQIHQDLVQMILDRDILIQEQLLRVQKLDSQIDSYERQLHTARAKKKGWNFVQDSYLRDARDGTTSSSDESQSSTHILLLESYLSMCDQVWKIQGDIEGKQTTIHDLETQVSDLREDNSRKMAHREELDNKIAKLKKDVEISSVFSANQEYQLQIVLENIRECDEKISSQNAQHQRLLDEEKQMIIQVAPPNDPNTAFPESHQSYFGYTGRIYQSDDQHVVQKRPFYGETVSASSKYVLRRQVGGEQRAYQPYVTYVCDEETERKGSQDSNSDTGLSSMHSDESNVVLETLV